MTPGGPPPILFDVYGTLLDTASVARACETVAPGRGAELGALWRARQLEYTWLRSGAGRYVNFQAVTEAALRYAVRASGARVAEDRVSALAGAYLSLDPFPEAAGALTRLRGAGHRCGVLSNGLPEMLLPALRRAGLADLLDPVLSADAVHRYKPHPRVYGLGPRALGCPAGEILFVSANGWDIAGAGWSGYRTFWVNRAGAPDEELDAPPWASGPTLDALAELLGAGDPDGIR
ncbi:MAG: haloacid dehalogenase type II [Thermoleophilia bacterium]|nr:haloacid dehalogenase type II [Thermoleophilia bacterium]